MHEYNRSKVNVNLSERSYSIHIGEGDQLSLSEEIARIAPTSAMILTHPKLAALYGVAVMQTLREQGVNPTLFCIPPGERYKTLPTVNRIYEAMLDAHMDRKSLLITLGGGVIGDMGGFAAATYLRGIPFIQIPTSLLAMVDASVGGKTGVDLPRGKNLVGAFHQPRAVIINTSTLRSLPTRELRAGLAEVIKHGIIFDKDYFDWIVVNSLSLLKRHTGVMLQAIHRSCEIKADVVSRDETEQGIRAILNFGHTVGHAIEQLTGYRRYKHGEAVAIGMISASLIGEEIGHTPPGTTDRIRRALILCALPTAIPVDLSVDEIIQCMEFDKKSVGGELRLVLLDEIGRAVLRPGIPSDVVRSALNKQEKAGFVAMQISAGS